MCVSARWWDHYCWRFMLPLHSGTPSSTLLCWEFSWYYQLFSHKFSWSVLFSLRIELPKLCSQAHMEVCKWMKSHKKNLAKGFWMCNDQNLIQNQRCYGFAVFLAGSLGLCHLTSRKPWVWACAHFALCMLIMPHNASGCFQMHLGSDLRLLSVIKVAVFLLYAQYFLILQKHNALIRENQGFQYFFTVILQHVSIKLLWLWIVSCQNVCF